LFNLFIGISEEVIFLLDFFFYSHLCLLSIFDLKEKKVTQKTFLLFLSLQNERERRKTKGGSTSSQKKFLIKIKEFWRETSFPAKPPRAIFYSTLFQRNPCVFSDQVRFARWCIYKPEILISVYFGVFGIFLWRLEWKMLVILCWFCTFYGYLVYFMAVW
jgi:hypothetical protein